MIAASQSFAVMLKQMRTVHGMTQEELAERSGVSVRSISDLERGISRFPRKDTVQLLTEALQLPLEEAEQLFALARAPRQPFDSLVQFAGMLAEIPCVGRERELAELHQRLMGPATRLLTLTGVAGIGKTRLALESAVAAQDVFGTAIKFVDLSPFHTERYVVSAIAQELAVREQPAHLLLDDVVQRIKELADQRLLLILDNCEQVLEARSTIATLLERCPGLTILATSREKLSLACEEVMVITPLVTPDLQMLTVDEHLPEYPAVLLFISYAQLLQSDLALTPVLIRTVAKICTHLDGIPLAIELAAARLATLPARTILAQLTGSPGQRFLEMMRQTAFHPSARQQTLREALAWSYRLLDAREQIIFRRACVFVGSWTTEAIEALTDPHQLWQVDMQATLTSLVNKSLIHQEVQSDDSLRYRMHFVMRVYGKDLLVERKEESAVYRQLGEYYATLVSSLEQRLTGAAQAESLRYLIQEYENIRAVLQWSREQQAVTIGLKISAALWWFWENRGYLTEGREWLEGMLALWQQHPHMADDETVARAYYGAAILSVRLGDIEQATRFAEASLKRMRSPNERARALLMLGNLAKQRRNAEESERFYCEGLAILRELDDAKGITVALNNLSTLYIERGNWQQALPLLEESISLKREVGDQRGVAVGLMNQGEIYKAQGQYAQARAITEEGLAIFQSLGDSQGEALARNNLGEIAEAEGDDARAIEAYGNSLSVYRRIEDHPGSAMLLQHLGELASRRLDAVGASYLQESADLYEELGNASGVVECGLSLARLHLALQMPQAARAELERVTRFLPAIQQSLQDDVQRQYDELAQRLPQLPPAQASQD